MKQAFIPYKPEASAAEMIDNAIKIINDYQAAGFTLTIRQLYYQFVSRDLFANIQKNYERLSQVISRARLAGMIDWDAIEDRTRFLRSNSHWDSVSSILDGCAAQFAIDMWAMQKHYPEVWIEKDALIGVIEPTCRELDVPYFACRGYNSQSEQYEAGRRMKQRFRARGQKTIVFHFGDHDPSGLDMTKDNRERLQMFAGWDAVEVRRLALNMDQVQQYTPPPNPAKQTDARFAEYLANYGTESWELDALEPQVIAQLIRDNVEALIEPIAWQRALDKQEAGRQQLQDYAEEQRGRED